MNDTGRDEYFRIGIKGKMKSTDQQETPQVDGNPGTRQNESKQFPQVS